MRSNSSGSSVTAMPASPPDTALAPCRLKQPMSPQPPTGRPRYDAPWACEQSSISATPWRRASSREAIERRGVAPHVHHADGARARGDAALDVGRVGDERAPVDVAEDGRRPALQDRGGGGEERVRRDDHLGPGRDAGREVGAVQRRGAAVHGQCVARPGDLREPPFEVGDRAVSFGERGDVAHRVAGDHVDVACVHRAPPLVVGHRHGARSPVDREASVRRQRRSPLRAA